MPPANERFHDALDEIEIKILDAKAVMERDLSVIRKKRALREGVKIPSKAASPIEIPTEAADNAAKEMGKTETDKPQTQQEDSDLPMIDINVVAAQCQDLVNGSQPQAPLQTALQAAGEKAITAGQGMPQDAENSAGLAISLPTVTKSDAKDGSKTADGAIQKTANTIADSNISTDQPGEQSTADFDFESMFNDADFTTADGNMNFDINFSTTGTGTGNQDILADNAFESIAMTSADLANVAATTNEDINSLLPGLDEFVNSGDVTAATGANSVVPLPEAPKATSDGVSQSEEAKPAEALPQFDDLFGGDTFDLTGAGTGTEEEMGDGNLADFDFDAEWLKM